MRCRRIAPRSIAVTVGLLLLSTGSADTQAGPAPAYTLFE